MKQAIVHGVPAALHPELIARGATLWGLTTVVMEELRIIQFTLRSQPFCL